MYQHHILLRTNEALCGEDALVWYEIVKEYSPENTVFAYQYHGKNVAMEYGLFLENEFAHAYTVPLTRDLTSSETMIIMNAWEVMYPSDFDIEVSNSYEDLGMGEFQNTIEYNLDEELKEESYNTICKWEHNRWLDEKISEGWRWGSYFSSKEKTHPALRDWDSLSEAYRRNRPIDDKEIYEWLHNKNIFK